MRWIWVSLLVSMKGFDRRSRKVNPPSLMLLFFTVDRFLRPERLSLDRFVRFLSLSSAMSNVGTGSTFFLRSDYESRRQEDGM